jgi:hypothetical protein
MANSLKGLWHEAAIGTRGVFDDLIRDWKTDHESVLPEEAMARYMLHRNNPQAMQQFVAQAYLQGRIPATTSPIDAMHQYEQAMEAALKKRGVK